MCDAAAELRRFAKRLECTVAVESFYADPVRREAFCEVVVHMLCRACELESGNVTLLDKG